jgi:RND family efflux transporter MFP subunit
MQSAEAAANVASAKAERKNAEIECQRAERLFAQGAITKSEADRTATRCESAGSQVSAATARASVIAKGVSDGVVRAPFDGVVSAKFVTVGEWVAPGRSLFTLVDADPLTIELSVPESSIHQVSVGQHVDLAVVSAPGKNYRAKVTRLSAEIGSSRSMIAEATLDPAPGLVPGMFAEASVIVGSTLRPVIPRSAAVLRGKDWHVFVVNETELEDRVVQIGPGPTPDEVAVTQNLNKDDIVVRTPTEHTADGNVWSE